MSNKIIDNTKGKELVEVIKEELSKSKEAKFAVGYFFLSGFNLVKEDFPLNLIDCLVCELYLGDVVKVPIRGFVEDKLRDIELPENLLETSEDKREKIFKEIKEVFQKLEKDKKLKENLYLIKLHPWVKTIYESLGR